MALNETRKGKFLSCEPDLIILNQILPVKPFPCFWKRIPVNCYELISATSGGVRILNIYDRFPFKDLSSRPTLYIFAVCNFFVDRQIELPSPKGGLAYKLQINIGLQVKKW